MQLVGAVGHDEEQAGRGALVADEERQQVAGGAVGPVGVFDDQHHGTVFREPLQQPEHLLEQPGPGLGPLLARLAELGQQPGQPARVAAGHQRGDAVAAELAHEPAQHGGERRERQALRAQLQAAADEHPGVLGPVAGELPDQPRLADPRLAADEHGGRRARAGPAQGVTEGGELAGTPDEQGAHGVDAHALRMPSGHDRNPRRAGASRGAYGNARPGPSRRSRTQRRTSAQRGTSAHRRASRRPEEGQRSTLRKNVADAS